MAAPIRRKFIIEPEEGLILTPTAFDAWENLFSFTDLTGLNPTQIVTSIICSTPIPRYDTQVPGPRRFSHVKPGNLWHPLFWLPPHLAQRASLTLPSGEPYVESWDAYALRIALEMGNNGVLTEHGWLDILSTVNINVDTAEGVRRIEQWQAGKPDPALDSIDTTDLYRNSNNPLWSLMLSRRLENPAINAQNHLLARSFLEALNDAPDEEALEVYSQIGGLAAIYLRRIELPENLNGEKFWDRIVEEANNKFYVNNVKAFNERPGRVAKQWLENLIRETDGSVEFLYTVLTPEFEQS